MCNLCSSKGGRGNDHLFSGFAQPKAFQKVVVAVLKEMLAAELLAIQSGGLRIFVERSGKWQLASRQRRGPASQGRRLNPASVGHEAELG